MVVLCAVLGLPAAAQAEPESLEGLKRRLVHPLAAVREAAEADVAKRGAEGRRLTAELIKADAPALRLAGWRIVARQPAWLDAARCRAALCDADARVAVGAARALIACAATSTPRADALLPVGCLSTTEDKPETHTAPTALGIALADALERAPAERVPSIGLALGEGAVPALVAIAREDRYHNRIRSLAVTVLGRIGGAEASAALVDLTPRGVLRDRTSAFSALMDVELDEAGRRLLYEHLHHRDPVRRVRPSSIWRFFFRGGGWGGWTERGRLRQLIRVHPPVEHVEALRDYYRDRLESRRRHPSESIDIVRGLLAVGDVEADDVELIVSECFESMWQPRWNARAEELGTILPLLFDLRTHRDTLREALTDLFDLHAIDSEEAEELQGLWQTTLPRSVEAWGHYVLEADPSQLEAMATELVRGDGEIPIWSARRLGVRLWERLGRPSGALVRELLADGDPWMRRQGLVWLEALPEAEQKATIERLRADEDDGVFLVALDCVPGALRKPEARRALRLAVEGTRGERARAWRRLARAAPDALPADEVRPVAPGLDRRLRDAHRYWTHLGLDEDLPVGRNR